MTAIYGRRCFQMRLTYRQLAIMLDHPDSPLIPAVGLLYVRCVVDPKEAWGFYRYCGRCFR